MVFCVAITAAQDRPYVIEQFRSEITLREDASFKVVEKIDVRFNIARRGIFRDIPIKYETDDGGTRQISIIDFKVLDENGNTRPTKVSRSSSYVRVRVGKEDRYFPPGTRQSYVISYEVYGALNWFDVDGTKSVELYWNVTGDKWDTDIQNTSFSVKFPTVEDSEKIAGRTFAGAFGSKDGLLLNSFGTALGDRWTDHGIWLQNESFFGEYLEGLAPGTGYTIALSLPERVAPKPSRWAVLARTIPTMPSLFTIVFTLGFMLFFWM